MFVHVIRHPRLFILIALFVSITTIAIGLSAQDAQPAPVQTTAPASRAPAQTPTNTAATSAANAPAPSPVAYDAEPLPQDPAAALLVASKANGLGSNDLKPWYLKAHYQTYDAAGKPAAPGILEVWWADKSRSRISYASAAFTRTTFRTPEGRFESGSIEHIPYSEQAILAQVLRPITIPTMPVHMEFTSTKLGSLNFRCVTLKYSRRDQTSNCLDLNHRALRLIKADDSARIFNTVMSFQHHFVGTDIQVIEDQQPVVMIHVDSLRALQPADFSALDPVPEASKKNTPASASKEEALWSDQPDRLIPPRFISGPDPQYPSSERRSGSQIVRLALTVGTDGRVIAAQIVRASNPVFGAAALKAVQGYKFKPATLDGQPTEAEIQVVVNFEYH